MTGRCDGRRLERGGLLHFQPTEHTCSPSAAVSMWRTLHTGHDPRTHMLSLSSLLGGGAAARGRLRPRLGGGGDLLGRSLRWRRRGEKNLGSETQRYRRDETWRASPQRSPWPWTGSWPWARPSWKASSSGSCRPSCPWRCRGRLGTTALTRRRGGTTGGRTGRPSWSPYACRRPRSDDGPGGSKTSQSAGTARMRPVEKDVRRGLSLGGWKTRWATTARTASAPGCRGGPKPFGRHTARLWV